ncbi:MAG: FixH family protein [Ardenticatenia bacterium]|nr:FixH family protein [Ardenticatenia bacterium]
MNTTRRWWLVMLVVMSVMSAVVACQRNRLESTDEGITVVVEPMPPRTGEPTTVTITLRDAEGAPVSGMTLEIEGNMNHAGMKPVIVQAEEVEPGRYVATLTFTMGGDWFIAVRGTWPDGRPFEHTVDVPGVRAK